MIFLRINTFDSKSFSECEGQQSYSNSENIISTSPVLYLIYFHDRTIAKLKDYEKPESSCNVLQIVYSLTQNHSHKLRVIHRIIQHLGPYINSIHSPNSNLRPPCGVFWVMLK